VANGSSGALRDRVVGQERPVGGDVVGYELPKDSKTRRDARILESRVDHGQRRVHPRGCSPQPDSGLFFHLARREPEKHAPVLATRWLVIFELRVYDTSMSAKLRAFGHHGPPPLTGNTLFTLYSVRDPRIARTARFRVVGPDPTVRRAVRMRLENFADEPTRVRRYAS
jgi:hypothetical protein